MPKAATLQMAKHRENLAKSPTYKIYIVNGGLVCLSDTLLKQPSGHNSPPKRLKQNTLNKAISCPQKKHLP
jgi:hypothetical protein